VFGAVGAAVASEGGGIVEGLAAEGSFADKRTFIVVSAHMTLIPMAGQENLTTHLTREGCSNFLSAVAIVVDGCLVAAQIGSAGV